MTLQERLLAIDRALDGASISHAFGGAIALAYWTLDPRGTSDIDVEVRDGVATLSGSVPSIAAWEAVHRIAVHTGGVVRVDFQVEVHPRSGSPTPEAVGAMRGESA